MTGRKLRLVPSRLESFQRFRNRFPDGRVLVPENPSARNYGANPYVGYDASRRVPFLYDGSLPEGIDPMERVIAVELAPGQYEAWSLSLLRRHRTIRSGDLVISWEAGQSSVLDRASVVGGRDVGNVIVRRELNGQLLDIPYDVPFAFAFHAFRPQSIIYKDLATGGEGSH